MRKMSRRQKKRAKQREANQREEQARLERDAIAYNGGKGELRVSRVDTMRIEKAADAKLLGAAIRQRWPIPDAVKAAIVEEIRATIEDVEASHDVKIKAGGLAVQIERINLEDEKRADPQAPQVAINLAMIDQQQRLRIERLNDPDYLDRIRDTAVSLHANSGALGDEQAGAEMVSGEASDDTGPVDMSSYHDWRKADSNAPA